MILFDSTQQDDAPETPRVYTPLIVRIPIDVDPSDILNDFEPNPITPRINRYASLQNLRPR
jgi:hypothetical protein